MYFLRSSSQTYGAAAGVNDGRAADQERFAPFGANAKQLLGDLANRDALGLLGRDGAVHELERLPLGRPLVRKHADARVPDDDRHSAADVGHGECSGPVRASAESTTMPQSIS